jgi:hypothetical protein
LDNLESLVQDSSVALSDELRAVLREGLLDESPRTLSKEADLLDVPPGTVQVQFGPFAQINWKMMRQLPNSVEILYLGHDGVTGNAGKDGCVPEYTEKDMLDTLANHLVNVREIHYCDYYSKFGPRQFHKARSDIVCVPII